MYSTFFRKKHNRIIEYLNKLGSLSSIYSEKRVALGPLLSHHDSYVYATGNELAIVLIDKCSVGLLAEKEELVWELATTCELFRNRLLRLTRNVPHVFGVIVTSDVVKEDEVKRSVWEAIEISVIDKVDGLESLSLPVNTDENLPVAFPLQFLYEAEFSEEDYAEAQYNLTQ